MSTIASRTAWNAAKKIYDNAGKDMDAARHMLRKAANGSDFDWCMAVMRFEGECLAWSSAVTAHSAADAARYSARKPRSSKKVKVPALNGYATRPSISR